MFLSATAIISLPRQFQVTVVANIVERHVATASWLFPLYLLLISLFVVPIAIGGITTLPASANPDLYVLTVPLAAGQGELALLAFIGGLSAATSMVIVASIALSIMISNHLVAPLLLRLPFFSEPATGDFSTTLLLGAIATTKAEFGHRGEDYDWAAYCEDQPFSAAWAKSPARPMTRFGGAPPASRLPRSPAAPARSPSQPTPTAYLALLPRPHAHPRNPLRPQTT